MTLLLWPRLGMADKQYRGNRMMIPTGVDAKTWFDSLVIDFPDDNIPILTDEKDWKAKGNVLAQEISFSIQGVPSTFGFNEFEPWAVEVFNTMNNF